MPIMYDAVDMRDPDQQPSFEASFGSYLYFVGFIGLFMK